MKPLLQVTKVLSYMLLLTAVSCRSEPPARSIGTATEPYLTEEQWQQFLESSDHGLWEDSVHHRVRVSRLRSFGGEEDCNPIFFDPVFIAVSGDTILVADRANETLVCFDSTGTLLWKYGGSGEGPGFLLGIGSLSIGDSLISVINSGLGFVDIVTRGGQFHGRLTSVSAPQNAILLDDEYLAVFSKQHPGGDVHIVNIEADSVCFSYGNGHWEPRNERFRSIRDIWVAAIGSGQYAYISQYESKLIVCNAETHTHECHQTRRLPYAVTPTESVVDRESGAVYSTYYPVFSSVFEGPENEICLVLNNLMSDGRMAGNSDSQSSAPVTCVDRYSVEGDYLSSFCLPDSSISKVVSNSSGYFVAIQRHTGLVIAYEIVSDP